MPPLTFLHATRYSLSAKPSHILCGMVLLANLGAWVWAVCTLGASPLLLGAAGLDWAFGLRHGLDADHIVAIDTVTRKLMLSGRPPLRVGLFFSLGHSSVVLLATAVLFILPLQGWLERWHLIGGVLGTSVSGIFMGLTVIANGWMALQQWRAFQNKEHAGAALGPASLTGWLLRPFFKLIGRAWHMYPLGFVFGLGFDTASEIGLLGMTTLQAAHGLGPLGVLSLPLLFTAGMALVDTLDTVLMCHVYGWYGQTQKRHAVYNLAITLFSLVAATGVGAVEVCPLILENTTSDFFSKSVDFASEHFSAIGAGILIVFSLLWALAQLLQYFSKKRQKNLK